MLITNVKVTPKLGPHNRDWVLLKVETDEGIVGLGEWSPRASQAQLEAVKRIVIGSDPININALHYAGQPHQGLWHMGGIGAGVEIALWDILGKTLGVPLYQLLGGKLRDRIPMFVDCHAGVFWSGREFVARWEEAYESGELAQHIQWMRFLQWRWRCRAKALRASNSRPTFPRQTNGSVTAGP
jgi:galactonate dehydratase